MIGAHHNATKDATLWQRLLITLKPASALKVPQTIWFGVRCRASLRHARKWTIGRGGWSNGRILSIFAVYALRVICGILLTIGLERNVMGLIIIMLFIVIGAPVAIVWADNKGRAR